MVEHPWMRLPAIANMFGLMLTAIGIFLTGLQLNNSLVILLGIVAFIPFSFFLILLLILSIDDYITLLPTFKRKFLGIPF